MGSIMSYGSYNFLPVPLYTWGTEAVYDGKKDKTYLRHTVDFTGTILELASESGLNTLIADRNTLKNALAINNQEWKLYYNGALIVSGVYPRVSNLSFEEGVWVDRLNYSFSFEYDEDFYNTGIESFTENWNYDEDENGTTVTVKHDISAVGQNTNPSGANNAFTNARTYVAAKTGYSNAVSSSPFFAKASGSYSAYESLRSEQVDVGGASYSVSETFTLSSGTYIHTSTGQLSRDENGICTVSLDGEIKGLGRDNKAFGRALTGWTAVKAALPQTASGIYSQLGGSATLFTTNYQGYSVTRNAIAGTIGYNISYTDSPSENLPSGILEFSLNVSDTKPVRLYASFSIMERALGNVVQDIGTSTEGRFAIQGTCVGKQGYPFASVLQYVQDKVNENRPIPGNYQTLRLDSKEISKEENKNTVQFNVSWAYTKDLSSVQGNGFVTIT